MHTSWSLAPQRVLSLMELRLERRDGSACAQIGSAPRWYCHSILGLDGISRSSRYGNPWESGAGGRLGKTWRLVRCESAEP